MKNLLFSLRKDNRGVSLIELIVVMAIMVVLVGAASVGISLVSTKAATQCAKNMQISLNKARINAMGKKNSYIAFIQTGDGVYMVERFDETAYDENTGHRISVWTNPEGGSYSNPGEMQGVAKIGKTGLDITVNGTDLKTFENGTSYIEFKRSDGSLKDPANLTIVVKKGTLITYTVHVEPLTGKVVFKQE
ncbi:MAG: type II secretion system GspH family protein [Lachnospiraceae bacterium]|nr:type II secretion system GspH family protein [Lachnospiraceae bacterium]